MIWTETRYKYTEYTNYTLAAMKSNNDKNAELNHSVNITSGYLTHNQNTFLSSFFVLFLCRKIYIFSLFFSLSLNIKLNKPSLKAKDTSTGEMEKKRKKGNITKV